MNLLLMQHLPELFYFYYTIHAHSVLFLFMRVICTIIISSYLSFINSIEFKLLLRWTIDCWKFIVCEAHICTGWIYLAFFYDCLKPVRCLNNNLKCIYLKLRTLRSIKNNYFNGWFAVLCFSHMMTSLAALKLISKL